MFECQSLNLAFLNLAFVEFYRIICPLHMPEADVDDPQQLESWSLMFLHSGALLDGRDPRAYRPARLT